MPDEISYDERVYRTEVYKGSEVTTYRVRWKAGGKLWTEGFRTAAQADSFRSALLTAARKGEAFSLATGRPTAWERKKAETAWYEFACRYVDMKWKQASAKYRKDIARALTAAAPAMLGDGRGQPDDAMIRRALLRYAFNAKQRDEAPADVAEALAWSPGIVLPCPRWRSLQLPGECSIRRPAGSMGRTRPRARHDGIARFWPTPWTMRWS
jgi:hypothetical protein